MNEVNLLAGESIVYESELVILTNQRLVAIVTASKDDSSKEAFLRDIASFRKVQSGEESKSQRGLSMFGLGIVFLLITFIPGLPAFVSSIVFLIGALGIIGGFYFVATGLLRVRPHTIVIFQIPDSEDIAVKYPGWDNPEVENLTRRFIRAKRGM